ncbi:MAG: CHASE3 domain-containing protein [Methanosarcinaceae archaeon]
MLNSEQNKNTTGNVFISQPDIKKEKLAGKLFLIIEINHNRINSLKIINFLINNLNHNYYNNEKIILKERIKTLKVEHIFEIALAKTNKNLFEFIAKEKIKINPESINATIGVIFENNIHFTSIGANKSLLIYKSQSKENEILQKYQIININEKINDKKPQLKINKLFSDIISGSVPNNGYFLFTNETLPEYFSTKQLLKIITKLPPVGAIEQIKNTLSKINSYVSFFAIIIKNTTLPKNQTIKISQENSSYNSAKNSITQLNNIEAETEKLLSSSGTISYKQQFLKSKNWILKTIFRKEENIKQKKSTFFLKDEIFLKRKQSIISIKKIYSIVLNIILYIIYLITNIIKILTNKNQLLNFIKNIKKFFQNTSNKIKYFFKWIKILNTKNKILFSLACISFILFFINTAYTKINNQKQEEKKQLENLIVTIEQKQNQIEAQLLYGNENGAKKILNEVKKLFKNLSLEKEYLKKYNEYLAKNNAQLEKIRHAIVIDNPKELANFTKLNNQANTSNIILYNNILYAGDNEQKTIYTINLSDNIATAITDLEHEISTLNLPTKDKNNNIYYLNLAPSINLSSLIKLNTETNELNNIKLSLPDETKSIVAIAEFNNKLYFLDNKNNQIYKFSKSSKGFTKHDNWLKENINLKNAVDLDIDGQIYILSKNGTTEKFIKGEKQDFKLDIINPPLEDASKIIVSNNMEYIYILEPKNNRLAIFNKKGNFILQYKSNKFNNLKDFAINEKEKNIYLLNENFVYEIEAIHF